MTDKTEPIWTEKHIEESTEKLYEMYSKAIDKDLKIGLSMVLHEFCILQCKYFQLLEAFKENHKVSSGAFKNSHEAVQLYAQIDAAVKTQGSSFSQRLETLEGYGK